MRVPSTRFPENSGTWDPYWLVTETSSCWFIVSTFVSFFRGTFRLEEDPPFVSLSHTPPWEYAGTPSKSAKENCLREGKTIGSSEMHHWMVSTLPMAFLRDGIIDMVCLRDGKTSFWNHLFFVVQWRTLPNRRKPMNTNMHPSLKFWGWDTHKAWKQKQCSCILTQNASQKRKISCISLASLNSNHSKIPQRIPDFVGGELRIRFAQPSHLLVLQSNHRVFGKLPTGLCRWIAPGEQQRT